MHEVSFDVDGLTLRGTIFYPEKVKEKNPAIYFLHGWSSSESSTKGRAEGLAKAGFIAMTFNMRGCGRSEGDIRKYVRKDFLNDALAAYDFLSEQPNVDKNNISLIGASFGGYLATLVTRERNVKHLVLRAPGNYAGDLSINHSVFSGDNSPAAVAHKFKEIVGKRTYSLEALHHFAGQVLIVECEKDDIIPHGIIEDYIDAIQDKNKLTHVVIKNADHRLKDEALKEQYTKILVDWFKNNV